MTLTSCGLLCTGGSGTNIAQFGVYDVSPALARDVYPKTLVAQGGYSDASFWLGFTPVGRTPYFGFHTPHTSGTALPASFPSGASLFTTFDPQGVFVGMR